MAPIEKQLKKKIDRLTKLIEAAEQTLDIKRQERARHRAALAHLIGGKSRASLNAPEAIGGRILAALREMERLTKSQLSAIMPDVASGALSVKLNDLKKRGIVCHEHGLWSIVPVHITAASVRS